MKQVYRHYQHWEDWKHGFYGSAVGESAQSMIAKVIEILGNADNCRSSMTNVIERWPVSMEVNFTNPSINRIAYLGQAACCLAHGVPETITKMAWHNLTKTQQDTANGIASQLIAKWDMGYLPESGVLFAKA